MPKVSIVIPVYNRESLVRRALDSAIEQTYKDLEILVVDDASTDETVKVVNEYTLLDKRIRFIRNDHNLGPVKNWIRSVELSRGEFLNILWSDDWLEPEAIEHLLWPLEKFSYIGFSFSAVELHWQSEGSSIRAYETLCDQVIESRTFLRDFLRHKAPGSPACALFRRREVEQGFVRTIPTEKKAGCHSYCKKYGFGIDILPFLRACDAYPRVYHAGTLLTHFLAHPGSITVSHMGKISRRCYNTTYAWFLSTSQLPRHQKRELNALLFVRHFLEEHLSALWTFSRLFPRGYPWMDIDFLNRYAWQIFARRLWKKVKKFLT